MIFGLKCVFIKIFGFPFLELKCANKESTCGPSLNFVNDITSTLKEPQGFLLEAGYFHCQVIVILQFDVFLSLRL